MRCLALLTLMLIAGPAAAQDEIPLPKPRPDAIADTVATPEPSPPADAIPLPRSRPDPAPSSEPAPADPTPAPDEPVRGEPEPADDEPAAPAEPVPPRIYQAACPAVLSGRVEARVLEPIAKNSCGERSPLEVTGLLVNGRMVPLSGAITTNCGMASLLPDWADDIDGYLFARENTRLARIVVGTSYMCRPRNNVSGADVSEHGFANALDVTGFELEDGRSIGLPEGWQDAASPEGRLLRFAHDAACARFTTTLGPEANALHHDHLHLDLGCHGRTCTARLCE